MVQSSCYSAFTRSWRAECSHSESADLVTLGGVPVKVQYVIARLEIQGLEIVSEKIIEMSTLKTVQRVWSTRTSTSSGLRKLCLCVSILERILKIMKMDTILKCFVNMLLFSEFVSTHVSFLIQSAEHSPSLP